MAETITVRTGDIERWLCDHDTDVVDESPPVQNTWYEVFHAQDVRLIWCIIYQVHDEAGVKDLEVRWTIDGTVYLLQTPVADSTFRGVYRNYIPSTGGTLGLAEGVATLNAALNIDKRGLDFKVEARITSVLGTNQILRCYCVRETLEVI